MTASTATADERVGRQVVITRTFDAPRALVFEAWSKAEHLKHWFGPTGFTLPTCAVDFRLGGAITVCMRSPDGEEFWSKGSFREIVVPERIVLETALLDDHDQPRFEDRTVVTFEERGGKTLVTVVASVTKLYDPTAAGAIDGMKEGWTQTLDHLETYLVEIRS
jgi:uncharacterized protein YndB with AHSA1/START domain